MRGTASRPDTHRSSETCNHLSQGQIHPQPQTTNPGIPETPVFAAYVTLSTLEITDHFVFTVTALTKVDRHVLRRGEINSSPGHCSLPELHQSINPLHWCDQPGEHPRGCAASSTFHIPPAHSNSHTFN